MQTNGYEFKGGFPTPETIQKAYDDADLSRAIEAYKFFYPSVSIVAIWQANVAAGLTPNNSFLLLQGSPHQSVFTPNSDTPYGSATLDVSKEPLRVIERYGTGNPKVFMDGNGAPRVPQSLLMARRLVEAGARVVTLNYSK